jgi:hypothetical protein
VAGTRSFSNKILTMSATSSSGVVALAVNLPTYSVATSSGATETISLGANVNGNIEVKIGGTPTSGDTLIITTNNVALSGGFKAVTYTVLSGDTITSIAAELAALINGESELASIGAIAVDTVTAKLAWSQSFGGSAALSIGMNSVAITVLMPFPIRQPPICSSQWRIVLVRLSSTTSTAT